MKLATFNINGIRSRLPRLLQWLARESPDIVCLQELKAADGAFPIQAIHAAGYGALWAGQTSWNGVAILAKGVEPVECRRRLPGNPADAQSRYLEAAVDGIIVGCLYLPNGNPQPGPKFDYKLAWFERLIGHAATLYAGRYRWCWQATSMLCPPISTSTTRAPGSRTPCCSPRLANAMCACLRKAGQTPFALCIRKRGSIRSGIISASTGKPIRVCASITCC